MTNAKENQLVRGEYIAMRLWQDEEPGTPKDMHASPYETVGFVIRGRAELVVGGKTYTLTPGDSYLVPRDTAHTYRILETFSAVEATTPPAP